MNNIIYFIIIFLIILYITKNRSKIECFNNIKPDKCIWLYWENPLNLKKPFSIELCHYLIKKRNKNVIILNEKTIKKYINLPKNFNKVKNIAHKADYIRVAILYKYGGIWIDSDMICLKSFDKIINLLNKYDLITFEYRAPLKTRSIIYKYDINDIKSGKTNHTFRIPIGFLATKKNNIIFKIWKNKIEDFIINQKKIKNWHNIGRVLLCPLVEKYVNNGKIKLLSYCAEDTVVPIKTRKKEIFNTNKNINFVLKPKNQYFISLFYSQMPILKSMTKQDLNKNLLIYKIFKYALDN